MSEGSAGKEMAFLDGIDAALVTLKDTTIKDMRCLT